MNERLDPQPSEWIDRKRPICFHFEGKEYTGYLGDTISSALWSNGVRVLGRSFKYHRPRGIFSLADQDSNVIVESLSATNIRADLTPLEEGLSVKAVNTVRGVRNDRARLVEAFSRFLPVGFYYKAFYSPRRLFPFYENQIRKMSGLGSIKEAKEFIYSPKRYDFCDVLVVGSGPAGLSAAIAAAEQNLRVILVEEQPHPGGTLSFQRTGDQGTVPLRSQLLDKVACLSNLDLRTSTQAVGHYADNWIALIDMEKMTKLRARSVIVATGCYEQPAVFRNNDLPGVMLASAAQRLMHQFAVKPFKQVVVLTANSDGYGSALDLHNAGIKVEAIVDMRPEGEYSDLERQTREVGIRIENGIVIYEALSLSGKRGVRGVTLRRLNSQGVPIHEKSFHLECDGIAMSVGWTPADGLLRQCGTKMAYSPELEQYVPSVLPRGVFSAGRVNGIYLLHAQIEDGRRAGLEAANHCGRQIGSTLPRPLRLGPARSHAFPIIQHPKGKNFVDLDEDIQLKDIENAIGEGFDNIELLKRYSSFGMGPSQGKHSNLNVNRILARTERRDLTRKEMTTARPFVSPVPLGHLAGRIFTPYRQTPMHEFHREAESELMHAGNWLRPEFYRSNGSTRQQAIVQEVRSVRQGVGLVDVSTLGKIEVIGSDATKFIEQIYTGKFSKLPVGMTRYLLMCDETGTMIDDGVVARLAENRFYLTTTTGASDTVFREMKRWALIWGMDVTLINVTGGYAAMNLAGPLSRRVLHNLTDVDLGPEAFPYLGVREGIVAGVMVRLLRVGFVGELGYELHVPAESGLWVWKRIMEVGRTHFIQPFGVEAQRMLRLEKGHLIIGQDSDGLTNPYEAGMSWAVKEEKPFFVGQRSLCILKAKKLQRRLVGFTLDHGYSGSLPKECNLVVKDQEISGRVTSVGLSPTLGRVIGLTYVTPQQSEPGTVINIRLDDASLVEAKVDKPPFYDPENLRQTEPHMRLA